MISSISSARPRAVHDLGDGAAPRHLAHVLAEVADGHAAIDGDRSLVRLLLAVDHAEERGFAGAVRADQAHLLAAVERRPRLDEDDLVAVLLADVVETDHVTDAWSKCLPRAPGSEAMRGVFRRVGGAAAVCRRDGDFGGTACPG
jgi:hypothetical protein